MEAMAQAMGPNLLGMSPDVQDSECAQVSSSSTASASTGTVRDLLANIPNEARDAPAQKDGIVPARSGIDLPAQDHAKRGDRPAAAGVVESPRAGRPRSGRGDFGSPEGGGNRWAARSTPAASLGRAGRRGHRPAHLTPHAAVARSRR